MDKMKVQVDYVDENSLNHFGVLHECILEPEGHSLMKCK